MKVINLRLRDLGKGQNVKNQNVKSLKVDQKFEKGQDIETIFLIDQNVENEVVDQNVENQNIKKKSKVKNDFRRSDFFWKDQLPMAYYLCGGLG